MQKSRIISAAAAAIMTVSMVGGVMPASADTAVDLSSLSASITAKKVRVVFDPNGGKVKTKQKTYTYGKKYGSLPTPTRSGYTFKGWYTKSGKRVTAKSKVTSKKAFRLYAHWEKQKTKCTLKFNANGGKASSTKKTYKRGKVIGTLPTCKKSGYVFSGWYTKKKGGQRITYSTKLKTVKNRTFYAHWQKASVANMKYKFSNSYEGFDYDYYYSTPYSRYTYVFDDQYAYWLYYTNGFGYSPWGGNCFGMSSSAAFNVTGKTNIHTFNKKAYFNKELSIKDRSKTLGLNVAEYCEAVQLTQFNLNMQDMIDKHMASYKSLVTNVKKCQQGKGAPVVIGLLTGNAGHGILAYKYKKVNKRQDRIYVYDCNYPEKSNLYITLYKNAAGKYTGFYYDGYSDLTYFPMSSVWNVWKYRGTRKASGAPASWYYGEIAVDVGDADSNIYTEDGELYATVRDGVVKGGDAYQMKVIADKLDSDDVPVVVYLPKGDYTIKSVDGSQLETASYFNGQVTEAIGSKIAVDAEKDSVVLGAVK